MKKILLLIAVIFLISATNRLEEGMNIPKFFVKVYNEASSGYSILKAVDLFNGKNKAVVISFFASYCKPCKKEIFVLSEFYNKYRDQGVMIIEISIDTEQEGINLFKSVVDDLHISMPCALDSMGMVSRRFGVEKLPTLFIFDKYGYVKKRFEGYTEDNVKDFEKVVMSLISDKKVQEDSKSVESDKVIIKNQKPKADSDKKNSAKEDDFVPFDSTPDKKNDAKKKQKNKKDSGIK